MPRIVLAKPHIQLSLFSMNPQTPLTRQHLYALMWSQPANKIAMDYGVSASAVTKACTTLNVPRPERGHWSKLANGHTPKKTPLPPAHPNQKETITFGEQIRSHSPKHLPTRDSIKVEIAPVATPTPPPDHPLIRKLRKAAKGIKPDMTYGIVRVTEPLEDFRISTTPALLERSIQFMERLIFMLERNGFELKPSSKNPEHQKLVHRETEVSVGFSIQEPTERHERPLTAEDKDRSYIWDRWRYHATQRLKVTLDTYLNGIRKTWLDGKTHKIEDLLTEIVEGFVIYAQTQHAQNLDWAERRRRWENEAAIAAAAKAREEHERMRRQSLIEASRLWIDAQNLRRFIVACETRLSPSTSSHDAAWLDWARSVACNLDPLDSGFLVKAAAAMTKTVHSSGE